MPSKQDSLDERIRETISGLSDEELAAMQRSSANNYTPFARQVLEEELRRRRMKAADLDNKQVSDDAATTSRDHRIGCYIDIWDGKNFEGEYMRIEGPSEYQTLDFPSMSWSDSISSIRVGPNAFVHLYADNKFQGKMMTLGPNQEVCNLEEQGFNDEIDSIKLVNSVRIFDGVRSEGDSARQAATSEAKPERKPRRKNRGRRGSNATK